MTNIDLYTDITIAGISSENVAVIEDAEVVKVTFDPELLYVECQSCGKPIIWESGKTTVLLLAAGVDLSSLDSTSMIVAEGCPKCQPEDTQGFKLAVVKLAGITAEEALHMMRPGGNA